MLLLAYVIYPSNYISSCSLTFVKACTCLTTVIKIGNRSLLSLRGVRIFTCWAFVTRSHPLVHEGCVTLIVVVVVVVVVQNCIYVL